MKKILLLCTTASCVVPSAAFAQSTGTVDFENEAIVVTGTRSRDVGGIIAPDAPKAKAVVTQDYISRTGPGQTVLDAINIVPGVSFQNNDAYGNAGGTLSIRGFDSTRISYTLDGIQLNDSGNYSIYSNFSIDPELIEQVNVNLGSTDVDSPTASAVGGTINQRTITPTEEMGGRVNLSIGEFDYRRAFGLLNFGTFTPFGTRAFVAASKSKYDNPYNGYGKLDRTQLNAKVFQPVGANGDFVSVAARYNRDRNNFFGSVPLRLDREPNLGFPSSRGERDYELDYPCTVDTPQAGIADVANNCGTEFDRRMNPSNSVNVRGNSRFSLSDRLTFTFDPSYQYTKANGGGTDTAREFGYDINPAGGRANCLTAMNGPNVTCAFGVFAGNPHSGVDLNGDGDLLDQVTVTNPSQTRTHRWIAITGLRYDISDDHNVRVVYTHDRANHRQTGEVGFVDDNGEMLGVFPVDDPVLAPNGVPLQKRDRQSYSILNKVGAEYRGDFGPLTVNVGASMPFFKRDLENYCFTSSATGFVECSGGDATLDQQIAAANPYTFNPETNQVGGWSPPGARVLKYSKFLPNLGLVYDFTPNLSGFVSYAKNISVPSTDNLYNAFYYPEGTSRARPRPETTDTFDGGVRYRSARVQAQLAGWFTRFNDRLASAYDPELDRTVFRNLGRVDKYGIDGSVAYEPIQALTLYAFGSWMKSEIKDNLVVGSLVPDCDAADPTTVNAIRSCAFTAGRYEAGSPKYTFGGTAVGRISELELGITAKRTGPRYVYDTNLPIFTGPIANPTEIYGETAPAYWLVNLDARLKLDRINLRDSYFQVNVYNLFDTLYVGGFGGGLNQALSGTNYGNPPFVQIGAPRTVSGTLSFAF